MKRKIQKKISKEESIYTKEEIKKLIDQNEWKKINIKDEDHMELEGFIELEELEIPIKTSLSNNSQKKMKIKPKEDLSAVNSDLRRTKDLRNPTKHNPVTSNEDFGKSNEITSLMKSWIISKEWTINDTILRNLHESGFITPMHIQSACFLPAYRDRKDIIGVAETGSGKTLAYGLPILCSILSSINKSDTKEDIIRLENFNLRALIIVPSRELSIQVHKHLTDISKNTSINIACLIGGIFFKKQLRHLKNKPEIIIGTPGRLSAFMLGSEAMGVKACPYLNNLHSLRHLVLDEADRLFVEGEFSDLKNLMSCIYTQLLNKDQLQTFIFSATLSVPLRTLHKKDIKKFNTRNSIVILIQKLKLRLKKIFVIDLTSSSQNQNISKLIETENTKILSPQLNLDKRLKLPDGLDIRLIKCVDNQKELELSIFLYFYLYQNKRQKIIIFVNTISYVYRLVPILSLLFDYDKHDIYLPKKLQISSSFSYSISAQIFGIHSSMTQKQRLKNLEKFQNSANSILICTDVASRGLDLKDINVVIHLQMPRNASIFVHRSGRTARAHRSGMCLNLCGPKEYSNWSNMLQIIGLDISSLESPVDYNTISSRQISEIKRRLKLAIEIEQAEHNIMKIKKNKAWLTKYANEGEINLSSEDDENKDSISKFDITKNSLQKKKRYFFKILQDKLF